MTRGGKLAVGIGAAAAGAAALYFIFKRNQGSLPSEWALPSFTTTQQMLSPPPLVQTSKPSDWAMPSFVDNSININAVPVGKSCRSSGECGDGVCINGSCDFKDAWES